MITDEQLEQAFGAYFDEIDHCLTARCYWALLHVLVILPDVCAALESDEGEADNGRYRNWCKRYFRDGMLTPEDRYTIRCTLLHQGRTVTSRGQYASYSFVYPSEAGNVFHRIVHDFGASIGRNMTIDISELAEETRQAIRQWFADLGRPENQGRRSNIQRHLPWLAKRGQKAIPGISGITIPTLSSTGGYMA